jgi:hypothetical protein
MELKALVLCLAWCLLLSCWKHASAQITPGTTQTAASAGLDPNLEQKPVFEQLMARKQALAEHLKTEAFRR